jgi:hypothetical protein
MAHNTARPASVATTPRRRLAMDRVSHVRASNPPAIVTSASAVKASVISLAARVTWNSITASCTCHIKAIESTTITRLTSKRTGHARSHFSH